MLRVRARWCVRATFFLAIVGSCLALSTVHGQASPPPFGASAPPGLAGSDGFLGTFADDQVSITLEPSTVGSAPPGVRSYAGTITGFGATYPFTATSRDGTELTGQFESGGHAFAFSALLSADVLTLTTGGVSYLLARVSDVDDPGRDDPRPQGLCETPADQLRRGVPTYIESFEATEVERVLGGILSVGADADGPWTASLTGRSYRLVNATNPYAVRFFYLTALPGEPEHGLTQGTTTMDLTINADTAISGAGILFGFEPTTRHYHALILTEGGYDLYRRDEDGLENRLSVKTGAARVGASNHLAVMVAGGDMRLFLNDVSLACLGSDEPIDGGIGIIAIGTGTFDIESFGYAAP